MAVVTVQPVGVAIDVSPDETVMTAAKRQGLRWPSVCGGDAECGTCWVVVELGAEHCSEISKVERTRLSLGRKADDPRARLACQLRVLGDVTVERRQVRLAR